MPTLKTAPLVNTPLNEPTENPVLSQLHDIILPGNVSAWPLAWGWWVLISFVLVSAAGLVYVYLKHKRKYQHIKKALNNLGLIHKQKSTLSDTAFCVETIALLKKTIAHSYPAQLSFTKTAPAQEFIDQLNNFVDKATNNNIKDTILKAARNTENFDQLYSANFSVNKHQLYSYAKHWVKHHQSIIGRQLKPQKSSQISSQIDSQVGKKQ